MSAPPPTEWTPGPWGVHPPMYGGHSLVVRSADSSAIAAVGNLGATSDHKPTARLWRKQNPANARLIASAPDLYAALEEAAKTFRKYAAMHASKGTVEGAQKAAANAHMAKVCEAALSKANPQRGG